VETPVGDLVLRGRIDAVFRREDGGWDVVDWKTGSPPAPRDASSRAVQLAVYRLAWARLHGVALDRVSAAFFYAATGATVRPVDLLDEPGLLALIDAATA
jgi:DNA helicase-2/ATP-dependent DNA helicase PcrA